MKLTVKMFAAARQLAGHDEIEVDVAEPATVGELKTALLAQFPGLEPLASHLLIAVDTQYADNQLVLERDNEIALIPPVSGG